MVNTKRMCTKKLVEIDFVYVIIMSNHSNNLKEERKTDTHIYACRL